MGADKDKIKIIVRHPAYRDYREPFFKEINKKFDVAYLFSEDCHVTFLKYNVINLSAKRIFTRITSGLRFIALLCTRTYDVLFSAKLSYRGTVLGLVIAKLRKRRVIVWEEAWDCRVDSWKDKLKLCAVRCIAKNIDAFYLTSSKTTSFYQDIMKIGSEKCFSTVQCSLDYKRYSTRNLHLPEAEGKKVILYLSRIIDWKGLDMLLYAYSLVKRDYQNCFLLIVGDGDYRRTCEQLAKELKLQDYLFFGWIPEEEKAEFYKLCDVFVLPSRFLDNNYEAWGLVVNEAMSMGKPVIVTDAVGCADDLVINGENGYIVKNSSAKDLASAIKKVLEDEKVRALMGEQSRRIFEEKNKHEDMISTFVDAVHFVMKR